MSPYKNRGVGNGTAISLLFLHTILVPCTGFMRPDRWERLASGCRKKIRQAADSIIGWQDTPQQNYAPEPYRKEEADAGNSDSEAHRPFPHEYLPRWSHICAAKVQESWTRLTGPATRKTCHQCRSPKDSHCEEKRLWKQRWEPQSRIHSRSPKKVGTSLGKAWMM